MCHDISTVASLFRQKAKISLSYGCYKYLTSFIKKHNYTLIDEEDIGISYFENLLHVLAICHLTGQFDSVCNQTDQ